MATKSPADTAKSIASALAFASYLVSNLAESELNELKQILWIAKTGSVFADISKDSEFRRRLYALAKQYIHPIDFEIGQLDKIPESSVILYSKCKKSETGVVKTLISWESIKPESKRVLLNKRLFGYMHHNVSYPGLVQKYSAEKLGKGCIAVPSQYADVFLAVFRGMKIPVHIKEVAEVG